MLPELGSAREDEYAAVVALLRQSRLPEVGLDQHRDSIVVARSQGDVVGCAAVERYGTDVLLRSVAVAPGARAGGVGSALVAATLRSAARAGARTAYLLTESAPAFFARRGFHAVARGRVPEPVRQSVEFRGACCASAIAMTQRLDHPSPDGAGLVARPAIGDDCADIARIYNQGIEDRVGTFETRARAAAEIREWFDGRHPMVVVERGDALLAFASTFTYRPDRDCYAGIAEFSVYVDRSARGSGIGRVAMRSLIELAGLAGFWKLVSRVFVENAASRRLLAAVGFREVGVYEQHARLDGCWRDVVIVERLLPENQAD